MNAMFPSRDLSFPNSEISGVQIFACISALQKCSLDNDFWLPNYMIKEQ